MAKQGILYGLDDRPPPKRAFVLALQHALTMFGSTVAIPLLFGPALWPVDNTADLRVLLGSRHPLLFVESQEEEWLLARLRAAAWDLDLPVWTWTTTQGLVRDEKDLQYGTRDPARALDWIKYLGQPAVFVFADIHPHLDAPAVVRAVRDWPKPPARARPSFSLPPPGRFPLS